MDIQNSSPINDISNYTLGKVEQALNAISTLNLQQVINGTGIVLHTGLGRAPISKKVFNKALNSTYPYANLEFNLLSR